MSPAKQKAKERQAARDRKALVRQPVSGGTGASAYNPVSGTFHTLESVTTDAGVGIINGRFKSIDDDDNSSLNGGSAELECMSNTGSCSGESEDQKEKPTTGKSGTQTGNLGSTDKRDKVRGKNERKHQRQKERRAQELRDKCTGYLMSRKLESLSQQLVAMGFSQERATMALIFNDGHIEQSVSWLLEGGESQVQEGWNAGNNPKIDISEELQRILEIEKKYKFSRTEIERAIVSLEGDLDKALESLQMRWSSSPTREESGKSHGASEDSVETMKEDQHTPSSHGHVGYQSKNNVILRQAYQIRRDDRTILHSKGNVLHSSLSTSTSPEVSSKDGPHSGKLPNSLTTNLQHTKLLLERRMNEQAMRFPVTPPKISSPYASHFSPMVKSDVGLIFGDPKLASGVSLREPVLNTPPKDPPKSRRLIPNNLPAASVPEFSPCGKAGNSVDIGSQSTVLCANVAHGSVSSKTVKTETKTIESFHTGIAGLYSLVGPIQSEPSASQQSSWISNGLSSESPVRHSRTSVAITNGLFTGWGVSVSPSSVDWSTGPTPNFDYRNIDWSMNAPTTTTATTVHRLSSSMNSLTVQDSDNYYWNNDEMKGFQRELAVSNFRTQSASQLGIWNVSPAVALQPNPSNSSGNTSHEWTSPFAGKELFNLPQAVPSPSL